MARAVVIAAWICAAGCRQIFGLHELADHDARATTDGQQTGDGRSIDGVVSDVPGLDGTTAAATLDADTYLSGYSQTTTINYGGSEEVFVETDPAGGFRPLLHFDVSSLAGKTVTAAELDVYITTAPQNAVTATVYRVTQPWSESEATWQNRITGSAWLTAGANPPTSADTIVLATSAVPQQTGVFRLVLTSDGVAVVNGWITGMYENAGFVIKGGTGEWKLASKENTSGLPAAALVVAY